MNVPLIGMPDQNSSTIIAHGPVVKKIRESLNLSQRDFSPLMGISLRTLQNWEQKRREPTGAARILLELTAAHPQEVLDVVKELEGSVS